MCLFQVKCSIRARKEDNDTSNYLDSKEFFAGIKVSTCPPVIYIGLGLWCLTPLLTIVQLYRGGHFIGRGNQTTQKKTTKNTYCRKSLTNFITQCCIECTPPCAKTLTSQVVVNPSHAYSYEVTGKMM